MSGGCPSLEQTQAAVARWCQTHDLADTIDYLHSSPAALAVVLSIVFGVLAYLAKPVVTWVYRRLSAHARRQRLLKTFSLELRHSEGYLRGVYSDANRKAWEARFDEASVHGTVVIPFQTYLESDFASVALRAELPDFKPVIAELIIRYYATDSLLATAMRDLRSDAFKELSNGRKKQFYLSLFDLSARQIDTCQALRGRLGDNTVVDAVSESGRVKPVG